MIHIIKKYADSAADKRLVSVNGRLMVMRKSNYWISKEMVVTPSHERYTTAATYATYGSNEIGKINAYMDVADGQTITANMRSIFAAKTADSWNDGHKAAFMYWDRGYSGSSAWGNESTSDPWYVANFTSAQLNESLANTVGCGASWQALYFNLYALPLYRCTVTGVYVRIYNPSFVEYTWNRTNVVPSGAMVGRAWVSPNTYDIGDGATKMQYNVFGDLPAPSAIDAEGDESVKIEFANAAISNQGNTGTEIYSKNIGNYMPWNTTELGSVFENNARRCCPYYHPDNSSSDYYVELAMTDEKKNKLMSLQNQGYGGFWLVIGPVIRDYFSTNNYMPGRCGMIFFSRVELFLRLSLDRFNDT